jgi:hypothetical protein
MKRLLGIIVFVALIAGMTYAKLPLALEGGLNVTIANSNTYVSISGGGIVDVTKTIGVRATLLNLNLTNGTSLYLGSGTGVDLIWSFPGRDMVPYGVGGFGLFASEGSTNFNLHLGGGVEFKMSSVNPFAEAILDIYSSSNDYNSDTNTNFTLRGGIRLR